jgi:hypothetical protein
MEKTVMNNERLRILKSIETGEISVEEGVRRLERLGGSETVEASRSGEASTLTGEQAQSPSGVPIPGFVHVVWRVVFGVGVAVLAGGGFLLMRAYTREGMPALPWGWVLFVLGLVVLLLGWWLERARWFTLRLREHGGPAFTIALPLPLGLVVGMLRVAKPFVPQLREMEADQLILAMRDELQAGRSFVVNVDEGEDGDRVEVYFCFHHRTLSAR